ncbi:MAG: hypothetical protein E7157_01530 [Lactobacillales bacterium]|nr:hypothetical protein [Lactobacillales bacterium]
MEKLIKLLVILLVLYFGIELSFINLNKGHNLEYKIKENDNTFYIKEIYTKKRKNEINNYYFEIKLNEDIYNFQTYKNYKNANYIIKNIEYFSNDNYKCVYLKDKEEKQISDVICLNNDIQYFYSNIEGKDKEVDEFVKKLKGYKKNKENLKNKIDAKPVILYRDNIIDNHYLYVENYKGIYLINKKDNVKNISLFKNDLYKNEISILNNENYITADYNEEYGFHEFKLVNIINGKKSEIISNDEISLDSYMQGSIDKEVYLFDKSDKKQYRINLKSKIVSLSGNKSKGIEVYKNNKLTTDSAYKAAKQEVLFNKYTVDSKFNDKEYEKVEKIGNKLSGYYYLYEKDGNKYKVYRVNVQNKKILTYMFTTDDIKNIYYYEDYIYYKDGIYIKYYQDDIGTKILLKNTEFEFNKTINFGLYVK